MATYYKWRKNNVQNIPYINYDNNWSVNLQTYGWDDANPFPVTLYYSSEIVANADGTLSLSGEIKNVSAPAGVYLNTIIDFPSDETSYYFALKQNGIEAGKVAYAKGRASIKLVLNGSANEKYVSLSDHTGIGDVFITQGPGTFVDYVYSTSSSAYPNGGVSGGYYYDQRTTVTSPTAPTGLTYPNPITTSTVTVSWDAATGVAYPIDHYSLSWGVDSGQWKGSIEVPAGTTSYQFSIPAGTTQLKFSVFAYDTNGQYTQSAVGPLVPVYLAPTLTVPQMVMQGQQATISWSAIEGADSYTLQRKSSADAEWTQVYSGANLSYSETVGTWTSVQYRVQAVFSGTPGGWAESAAIPVVSSSALVISGTDGDLGTVVNDIPYSISTDTGNQITATISVNSAVIFSGNVGTGAADSIPVLDLVNGEGTIVIEASVQATSGPVSAVRTWTYTKAPITFPNAGSVAQLTQQGTNIWPKTLAECVRLPGGRTLDEVMGFPAQVFVGSYTGTGTYGSANPNEVTFPFKPQIVFVSNGSVGTTIPMIRPLEKAKSSAALTVAWTDDGVSWSATSAANQMNANGTDYIVVAFG